MGLIRLIIWALLFYLIFKVVRTVFNYFVSPGKRKSEDPQSFDKKKDKSAINRKDIIEAEFEEIEEDKDKANN